MKELMTLKELEVELFMLGGATRYRVTEFVIAGWNMVRTRMTAKELRAAGEAWLVEHDTMPAPANLIAIRNERVLRAREEAENEARAAEERRIQAEIDAMSPEQRAAHMKATSEVLERVARLGRTMRLES